MKRLYVYALTDRAGAAFRIDGHTIEFEKVGGIYAAVERVAGRPPISEAALRSQHAIVSRLAEASPAVLPARFGAFVDRAELARVVELRRDALDRALDLVRGRVQMTVRVSSAEAAGGRDGDQDPGAAPHDVTGPARVSKTGTLYLLERKAAVGPRLEPELIAEIDTAVETLTAATRAERGNGRTLATLYHLIDREAPAAYRRAMADVERRLTRYTVAVSGPWAAFAFAPELWT
jgi:hypothetical protein